MVFGQDINHCVSKTGYFGTVGPHVLRSHGWVFHMFGKSTKTPKINYTTLPCLLKPEKMEKYKQDQIRDKFNGTVTGYTPNVL